MSRVIEVKACRQCPYSIETVDISKYDDKAGRVSRGRECHGLFPSSPREIQDPETIPAWCPLEEANTTLYEVRGFASQQLPDESGAAK